LKILRFPVPRQFLPNLSKPLLILLLLVFFKQAGNGMVWTVLALYGQELGASAAVIGLMISLYGGTRLMMNIPAGYASEKYGRRRMMSAGCAVLVVSSLWVVVTNDLPSFFIAVIIQGLASSLFMTSALASVADLGTAGRRIEDMSLYQAANMIGASMGPALGGILAGLWGYDAPFWANGLIALCGIAAFASMPWKESAGGSAGRPPAAKGQMRALAKQSVYIGLMYFSIFYVRSASNWILMPLIAYDRFGMGLAQIGLVLTAGSVANLCMLGFTAPLNRWVGRMWAIIISSLLTLIACALLAFGDDPVYLWASSILFGVGGAIATPTLVAYISDIAAEGQRGPAMGLLRTCQDLALMLGPVITGLLSDHLGLGHQGGLLGCLVLLGAATVIFRWGERGR
jgi:DHA1 family multidrug resistance protein-like MFS transporter